MYQKERVLVDRELFYIIETHRSISSKNLLVQFKKYGHF